MTTLLFPIPNRFKSRVSSPFLEPRPLSVQPEERRHVHGAADFTGDDWNVTKVPYLAPEDGRLYCMISIRPDNTRRWPEERAVFARTREGRKQVPVPFLEYFHDVFGPVMFLHGKSGLLHVFAHSFGRQVFELKAADPAGLSWDEQPEKDRFPVFSLNNFEAPTLIRKGEIIGYVGDAGYSFGKHLHYEVHHRFTWERWEDRADPETLPWEYTQ